MRKSPTKSEALLWEQLKGKKLDGLKFRRQHPIQLSSLNGNYDFFIADFCCLSRSIIIELDGDIHKIQEAYDLARDRHLIELGFKILRIPNDMVVFDMKTTLDLIRSFKGT